MIRSIPTMAIPALLTAMASTALGDPHYDAFERKIRPFLQEHCVRCHGEEKEKGGVRLDTIGPISATPEFANTWLEIQDQVLHYDMPPEDEPEPSEADRAAFINWIATDVQRAQRAARETGGKVVMRRLNRNEYAETLRHLLLFHPGVETAKNFPDDDTYHGFDTVGSALNVSPVQMQAYVENAARVLKEAFPRGEAPKSSTVRIHPEEMAHVYRALRESGRIMREAQKNQDISPAERQKRERAARAESRRVARELVAGKTIRFGTTTQFEYLDESLIFDGGGGVTWSRKPQGLYRFRFRMRGVPNEEGDLPMLTANLSSSFEDLPVLVTDVGPEFKVYEAEAFVPPIFNRFSFGVATPGNRFFFKSRRGVSEPRIDLDWLEIEGPIVENWPSRAWHEYFAGVEETETGARSILEKFAERTFRRPPRPERVDQFLGFYRDRREAGDDFQDAVQLAMQVILSSPEFIYMIEDKGGETKKQPLDGYELATRLAYFLWSGPPDEELERAAANGSITSDAELRRQIERMIHHPRAENLAVNFTGQWLKLRTLGQMAPDPRKYKEWEPTLQDSLQRETELFFLHILQEGLPVTQFIASDFAMLNSRVAYFYDIPGIEGYEFRPVALRPGSNRSGLLSQGSILTLTSDGIRTSPVKRGTFILENILGDPPPPPPNDVPPVEQSEGATLKERLKAHREIPACANCHNDIDPLGFALENFNAIGKWRTKEEDSKQPVDPSGSLPGSGDFESFQEFQTLLLERRDDVARCLTEKLMLYGLGRPIELVDHPVIDEIVQVTRDNGYRLDVLVRELILSDPFRTK